MILDYYNIKSTCCGSRFVYVQKNDNIQDCSCLCKRQKITIVDIDEIKETAITFFKSKECYAILTKYNISCLFNRLEYLDFGLSILNEKIKLDDLVYDYEYANTIKYLFESKTNDLKEYFESDYLSDLWSKINKLKDNLIFQ